MRSGNCALQKKVEEYERLLPDIDISAGSQGGLYWRMLQKRLQGHGDWTPEGAAHITRLARDYGAFMLRNALALATALGIEDGALGF